MGHTYAITELAGSSETGPRGCDPGRRRHRVEDPAQPRLVRGEGDPRPTQGRQGGALPGRAAPRLPLRREIAPAFGGAVRPAPPAAPPPPVRPPARRTARRRLRDRRRSPSMSPRKAAIAARNAASSSTAASPASATLPESARACAVGRWLSARVTASVGRPRQQRSQELLPIAPIAASASSIARAMSSSPTWQRKRGSAAAMARTRAMLGATGPSTTSARAKSGMARQGGADPAGDAADIGQAERDQDRLRPAHLPAPLQRRRPQCGKIRAQQGVVEADQPPAAGRQQPVIAGRLGAEILVQQQVAMVRRRGQVVDHQQAARGGGKGPLLRRRPAIEVADRRVGPVRPGRADRRHRRLGAGSTTRQATPARAGTRPWPRGSPGTGTPRRDRPGPGPGSGSASHGRRRSRPTPPAGRRRGRRPDVQPSRAPGRLISISTKAIGCGEPFITSCRMPAGRM